jgi:hypothetical protein
MLTRLPRPVLIGVLAIASATGIWVLAADTVRRSEALDPTEIESLVVIIVTGCLLDAVIAYRAIRGRVGIVAYGWLGFRILLSVAGLLLVTLPSYAIALVALSRYRAPAETSAMTTTEPTETTEITEAADPSGPHA